MTCKPKLYRQIHNKIVYRFGKADKCENKKCLHRSIQFEWANKDHKYSLYRRDWKKLCQICHWDYDRKNNNKYAESIQIKIKNRVLSLKKRRCLECKKWFKPHKFKHKQKYCSARCRTYNWFKKNRGDK